MLLLNSANLVGGRVMCTALVAELMWNVVRFACRVAILELSFVQTYMKIGAVRLHNLILLVVYMY